MRKSLSAYLSRLHLHLWRVLIGGVLLILVLIWIALFWQASSIADAEKRFTAQNEAYRTLLQLVGGVAIVAGAVATWRTLRATQRTVEATEKQVQASEKQVEIAREGQITDRFNKAVEHLGSPDLTIRLGGIYALERIAEDSETHRWPAMEVLTAFVRENVPRKPSEEESDSVVRPRTDIQAILTVIGRRSTPFQKDNLEHIIDLNSTDLRETVLLTANLQRALLFNANLSPAYLLYADLSWAHLEEANLHMAYLHQANLSNAHLEGADLSKADLTQVNLSGADLTGANLTEAYTRDEAGNPRLVTSDQLALAKSLEGAIMPDGSKQYQHFQTTRD
ncbi:MAG: pentapeptide repeat-containing protein [Anaerolineae bacterium]